MIWLTWRQFRGSAAMMAALLVTLVAALALTGPELASSYSTGITACTRDGSCDRFYDRFFDEYQLPFMAVSFVVLLLPALIGLFWGAPLIARELEAGTHLLVWNQSITRGRWLTVKLGLVGLAAVAVTCLCGLAVTWWSDPLDRSAASELALMAPLVFGARGIVPMGYAAFAFVLGVTVGMLVRRTLPAMALTLVVFAAIQIAMPLLVRPHLMPPVTSTFELSKANVDGIGVDRDETQYVRIMLESVVPGHAGAWVLSSDLVDPTGRTSGAEAAVRTSTTSGPCAPQGPGQGMDSCVTEINRLGYRQQATYQPLERFWPFQWIETGIYALFTVGLTWFCFWWVGRRLS
ncbi:ABC transporter permease [Streptosporangium sp. NPDC000509]|uniref:ABC transporter permease n=1 Tax=Streptosporangium sp. NPDC000509 TaxID=3366186 RepID=UPI00368DEDFA